MKKAYTIQYNTIQYNTIQYNTIQYNTIQYNTIQYNTIQYNTRQPNTNHHINEPEVQMWKRKRQNVTIFGNILDIPKNNTAAVLFLFFRVNK